MCCMVDMSIERVLSRRSSNDSDKFYTAVGRRLFIREALCHR